MPESAFGRPNWSCYWSCVWGLVLELKRTVEAARGYAHGSSSPVLHCGNLPTRSLKSVSRIFDCEALSGSGQQRGPRTSKHGWLLCAQHGRRAAVIRHASLATRRVRMDAREHPGPISTDARTCNHTISRTKIRRRHGTTTTLHVPVKHARGRTYFKEAHTLAALRERTRHDRHAEASSASCSARSRSSVTVLEHSRLTSRWMPTRPCAFT